jgi:hypothetical protein
MFANTPGVTHYVRGASAPVEAASEVLQ